MIGGVPQGGYALPKAREHSSFYRIVHEDM
jgi:hypothetical protein